MGVHPTQELNPFFCSLSSVCYWLSWIGRPSLRIPKERDNRRRLITYEKKVHFPVKENLPNLPGSRVGNICNRPKREKHAREGARISLPRMPLQGPKRKKQTMRRAPIINCIEAPKESQVNTFWHLLLLLYILVFFLSPCFPSEKHKEKDAG